MGACIKMTRYQIENAVHKINGYYLPNKTFEEAKKELLKNLKKEMKQIESITLDQFKEIA